MTQADIDDFRAGIDPLAAAGKLGALLAQFPPSFKDSPQSRDYLAQLLRAFADYPIAVELRHKSWSDAIGETLSLLNAFGAAWVQIDEPKFRFSIRQNYLPNVTSFYYMRLHGRNAAQWWKHDKSEDRYNYLYSADELQEFSETADAAKELVKKSYLYTNNHFSSKSVVNAVMLKAQLGEPIEGEYPDALVERYPELAERSEAGYGLEAGRLRRKPLRRGFRSQSYSDDPIGDRQLPDDVHPGDHLTEHGVPTIPLAAAPTSEMNIWLSASRGSPGCAIDTAPTLCCRLLLNSATPIELAAARIEATPPPRLLRHVARLRIAELHD